MQSDNGELTKFGAFKVNKSFAVSLKVVGASHRQWAIGMLVRYHFVRGVMHTTFNHSGRGSICWGTGYIKHLNPPVGFAQA